MADKKPNIVARLKKGKLISTVSGVVATWNWLASCWNEIKGSAGIAVENVTDGKPELKLKLNAGSGVIITDNDDEKTVSVDVDTLATTIADIVVQRLDVNITGADSNVVVTKNGLNFTIGVYYK